MCKCTISNRSGAHQYEGERWRRIEFCPTHAAAPALLEALEIAVEYIEIGIRVCETPGNLAARDKARAAIAQAKGAS